MRNVKIVRNDGTLGQIFQIVNRKEGRQQVLAAFRNDEKAVLVEYGRKVYTGSEVYRTW